MTKQCTIISCIFCCSVEQCKLLRQSQKIIVFSGHIWGHLNTHKAQQYLRVRVPESDVHFFRFYRFIDWISNKIDIVIMFPFGILIFQKILTGTNFNALIDYVKHTVEAFNRNTRWPTDRNTSGACNTSYEARLPLAVLSVESDRPVARHSSTLQASSICYIINSY